jgi:hypothetical protein
MSWLQKLERRLTPLAIVNITMYIVIGQTFVYLTTMFGLLDGSRLMLVPALALQGEWWRLLTFVADPPIGALAVHRVRALLSLPDGQCP